MDGETTLEILGSAGRAAMGALSLHELLLREEREDLARLAWMIYLEASRSAERMGLHLGVEADVTS